jgi:small acid-soluble spore protein D (minor alpha/beta-type SASP)
MARRGKRRRLAVPGAEQGVDKLKANVMANEGYRVDPERPDTVKYEVARALGIPLHPGYNGKLSTESAGKVGGPIGGAMVREMIRMAQIQLQQTIKRGPE